MELHRPLAVVTPTLDGEVLTVLAGADAQFTPGQVARLITDVSVEGVRKVLRRLAGQGIVDADQVGRAYAYRLNRDHLAASAIVELASQRATLIARLNSALGNWPNHPVYGALFGSAVRGQMRPDSDIDIFLVRDDGVPTQAWEATIAELAAAVARWTGNDARVLDMTDAEVRTAASAGDPVLASIADEGLTLTGPPDWLRTALRRAASR